MFPCPFRHSGTEEHQLIWAVAYRKPADTFKMNVSMSRRANAWDNAPMENLFKTLKVERIYRTRYETRAQAHQDIVDWTKGYYDQQRLHTSIDYLPLPSTTKPG